MKGWVYIATNKALEGFYKVGFSERDPQIRMGELSNTSVPYDFELIYAVMVNDANFVERKIHEQLESNRVSKQREFFNCDPLLIFNTIQSVCKEYSKQIYYEEKTDLLNQSEIEKIYRPSVEDLKKIRDFFVHRYQEKSNEISQENDNQYYIDFRKSRESEFITKLNQQLSDRALSNWASQFSFYNWTDRDLMFRHVKKELTYRVRSLLIEYGVTVDD